MGQARGSRSGSGPAAAAIAARGEQPVAGLQARAGQVLGRARETTPRRPSAPVLRVAELAVVQGAAGSSPRAGSRCRRARRNTRPLQPPGSVDRRSPWAVSLMPAPRPPPPRPRPRSAEPAPARAPDAGRPESARARPAAGRGAHAARPAAGSARGSLRTAPRISAPAHRRRRTEQRREQGGVGGGAADHGGDPEPELGAVAQRRRPSRGSRSSQRSSTCRRGPGAGRRAQVDGQRGQPGATASTTSRTTAASPPSATDAERRRAAAPSARRPTEAAQHEGGHRDRIGAVAAPLTERGDAGQHRLTSGRPGRAHRRDRGGRDAQPRPARSPVTARLAARDTGSGGRDRCPRRPASGRRVSARCGPPRPAARAASRSPRAASSIASETSELSADQLVAAPSPRIVAVGEHEVRARRGPRSRATPART